MSKKVNLFVAGMMRAGTTSLFKWFEAHPDVYTPSIKEPNFFTKHLPEELYRPSKFFSLENYLQQGMPDPVHIAHVREMQHYNALYQLAGKEPYLLDSSPLYFHSPGALEAISRYNPDARVVLIKRDPMARLQSHFKMNKALGLEKRTLERALEVELSQAQQGTLPWHAYLSLSLWDEQWKSCTELFEHVIVLDFNKLVSNPDAELQRLCRFLDIPTIEYSFPHSNAARTLKYEDLVYRGRQWGIKDYFSRWVPRSWKYFILDRITSSKKDPDLSISNTLQTRCESYFSTKSEETNLPTI